MTERASLVTVELDERPAVIRRFATPGQRRRALAVAVLGNAIPIIILGQHHHHNETERLPVVLIGSTVAILSPILVNLIPVRFQGLLRAAAFGGLIGLTSMQADAGLQGGVDSPFAILLVMPMIWFGLMTTGRDLRAGCALVVACCFLPPVLFPAYYGQLSDVVGPALALSVVACSVAISLAELTRETTRLTDQLRSAAVNDLLTGLLNRRGWEEITEWSMRDRPPRASVCVSILDLDNLKQVNDELGHDAGDALLRGTGQRLRDHFAQAAAVARLGGDEFAILVIGESADSVLARLDALRSASPDRAGFSAGVALAVSGEDLRATMQRADAALYEVKTSGRGQSLVADRLVGLDQAGHKRV